jgi:hypothetical protein
LSKYHANKGVERNKKPLKNIVYLITLLEELKNKHLLSPAEALKFDKYKFADQFLVFHWKYQGAEYFNTDGFITPDALKSKLGTKQWSKFCQGQREFIIQRRVDGKNINQK